MAAGGSSTCHCHAAQVLPFHRIHLRAWRTAALAVHWPFTTTIPGPQPNRTCVIKLSDCRSGARVIACDVVAMAKAKPTRAMSLIILFLPYKNTAGAAMSEKLSGWGVVPDFWRVSPRNSFPRRGAEGRGNPAEAQLHPVNSTRIDLYQKHPRAPRRWPSKTYRSTHIPDRHNELALSLLATMAAAGAFAQHITVSYPKCCKLRPCIGATSPAGHARKRIAPVPTR